mmetsp:Transcript_37545/g.120455  ORF Transcript_37545/g.120455 Transcript_37545/m.120455 type:complete len:262 (-) Transcript_37545:531-1316(-)|eukprot:CAMPEP_0118891122 /NCGR_PEP_ID=MMETSP1166-20130328/1270_1 /TAXON_ID=1104430 /ORGANISM="Chrysoreinhardia sp, Strain CCMP3193" /LENGTH=261 /DNA_ID=CAMNT_0006829765 /DNA_START=5 /DNA_END=790 /DNA_ORIENTATION=+
MSSKFPRWTLMVFFLLLASAAQAFAMPKQRLGGPSEEKRSYKRSVVVTRGGGASAWATTVAPSLGAVVANGMFLSSLPAVLAARKSRALGDLNPVPWAFIVANCLAWLHYSYAVSNPYAFFSNCFGAVLGLFYVTTGVALGTDAQRKSLERIVLFFAAVHLATSFFSTFWLSTVAQRQLLTGYVANVILVIFYGAPLSTLAQVLKTKSAASIYAPLSLLSGINGALWVTYGLAVNDLFIAVPNAAGLLLSLVQLSFKAIFR